MPDPNKPKHFIEHATISSSWGYRVSKLSISTVYVLRSRRIKCASIVARGYTYRSDVMPVFHKSLLGNICILTTIGDNITL